MSDHDVQALKEFRAELDAGDTDAARARVRHRIARAVDGPAPRRRWVPVLATGATAAAVLIGTVAVLQPGNSGPQGGLGSGGPAVQAGEGAKPTPSATRSAAAAPAAISLPRAEPGPLTAEGLTIGANQLLYIRSRSAAYEHEQWAEPDGTIVIAIQRTEDGRVIVAADEASMLPDVAEQRTKFADDGQSIALPTRAYLAGLTTDPVALRTKLKAGLGIENNDAIIKGVTVWLYRVDPILTPAVRTALVQALDSAKGVRVDHSARTLGGRSVYVVEQTSSRGTDGVIVDVETGRFVGSYAAGGSVEPWSTATRWEYAVVNR
jgi:hypothetical protein